MQLLVSEVKSYDGCTRVGTVEPRNTAVNIFNTQPVLRKEPNAFYAAKATAVDPKAQTVTCQDLLGADFTIGYDALVVATGSQVRLSDRPPGALSCKMYV